MGESILPELIKDYVKIGRARIGFKDFQFLAPVRSVSRTRVWVAAPGRFRAWHKAMLDKGDNDNTRWRRKGDIAGLTNTVVRIDVAKVQDLMTSLAPDLGYR